MINLTTLSLIILSIGIFTSEKIVEIGLIVFTIPTIKFVFDWFKNRDFKLPKSAYWLLGFILIALLSLWVNAEDVTRLSTNRNKLAVPLLGLFGIITFRRWLADSDLRSKKIVLSALMVGSIVCAIFGICIFIIEKQPRLNGLLYVTKYAHLSSYFITLTTCLWIFKRNFLPRSLLILALTLTTTAMILTFSRGPILALAGGIPFGLYYYNRKLAYIFGLISLTISLVMGGYFLFGKENTGTRFLTTKSNESDSQRTSIWQAAVIAIKERPVIGWGYFNFRSQMERIKYQYDLPNKNFRAHHSHNNFLEITTGTGFIGLTFFLGWFLCWFKEAFTNLELNKFIIPFFATFFISGMIDMTIVDNMISVLIYFVYALSSSQNTVKA